MTKIGAIIKNIENWFSKEFKSFQQNGDKVAVAITTDIQLALKSGIVDRIANIVSAIFPSVKGIPEMAVNELQVLIPKLLAAELAIQGLPTNPTPEDLRNFATSIEKSFNVDNSHSQLWTTLAAQIYGILQNDSSLTFASLVADVEQAYQYFIQDQQATA
jgi:hypothetical protein